MTEKTYGVWKVTEREYQIARKIASHGTGSLSEGAYQVVRYCEGQIFYRDDVAEFLRALREPGKTAAGFYTLTEADVGRATIHCFGKPWTVSSFIGRILPRDVGKRVYRRDGILQVENDEQRDERLRRAS